uniref:SGNH_hydro domain-containing protein n=1 Tax=Haemonchus contortus TaxID=6289 RepID=A0A7I4Y9P4_HAECO
MLLVIILLATTHARVFHKPRDFRCQSLVVFGDSLSDDGVEATGESHGFTRNSNGKIWPEYVERMLQCDEYINYAYSGAKSGQDNFYFEGWSGVGWQVQRYLENHLHLGDEPLVILQVGGVSDYFTGEKDTSAVVANIEASMDNITKVMRSGTLLVLTLLDLSSSPGVRGAEESGDLEQRIGDLVAETNRHLGRIVFDSERGVRRLNPELRIRLLDINTVVMEAMNSLNITEPFTYQTLNVQPRSIYGYAYHDLWNPSTMVHYALAEEIVKQLQDL